MSILIVIPARFGSTRFPGKPLASIAGRPMLERVIRAARAGGAGWPCELVVATDDERIAALARSAGAASVMTDPALPSGTDRAEAALRAVGERFDFVVNLQGDAPFTPPAHIAAVIQAGARGGAAVATPVVRLDWEGLDRLRAQKALRPFSGTTCVCDAGGRALWFSKTILPAIRDEAGLRAAGAPCPVLRHVGLYGYTPEALRRFVAWPLGQYERLEGLEQLRFIEHGTAIRTVEVVSGPLAMTGVDTPEDLAEAEALIARHGDPHAGSDAVTDEGPER